MYSAGAADQCPLPPPPLPILASILLFIGCNSNHSKSNGATTFRQGIARSDNAFQVFLV